MKTYYYLDVSLIFEEQKKIHPITVELFKKNILRSIKQLFGETISNCILDILRYDAVERRAIIRVPIDIYIKVRTSLTLASSYENIPCKYQVHQAKPILLALLGDSRDFIF